MTIEVIAERIENLISQNAKEHKAICDRLDHTNGDVGMLKSWRLTTEGFLKGVQATGHGIKILWGGIGAVVALLATLISHFI